MLCVALAACGSGMARDGDGDGGPADDDGGPAVVDPDADPGPPVLCEVVIDCDSAEIPDEPKIPCDIEIGDGKGGVVYEGPIGIERRGRSSLEFPKAQYSIELRTDADAEQPVALFGMGKESDWVLNGMYIDRALFRNKLFYDLFQRMGGAERYAPETRFCELTLDDDPRGIYLLTEKVKRDDDRIALAETGPDGDSFILKQDDDGAGFHQVGVAYGGWQLVYPNDLEATEDQITGISAWLDGWEAVVNGDGDVFELTDLDNAVDFVLLQEFARGNDAYFLSMHVWKDVGGKLHFTPWDLDLSLGQPIYGDSTLTTGWINYRPVLVQAMADDARFAERLAERWAELRSGDFAADALEARIQSYLAVTGDRIDANFERWPIEDIHFFDPDQLPPRSSHAEEMASVRSWIAGRLEWMDDHIDEYAAGN